MESKRLGDLRLTLYETAQELLSIYRDSTPKATRESLASLRVVLFHLDESTRLLTKLSEGEANTKMER